MESVRTCVGCRQRAKQHELLRLIAQGESLVVDRFAVGRGAWLHQSRNCFELAITRLAFSRALRTKKQFDTAAVAAHIEQAEMMLAQK
jgi:predicted RNA-binding protein YlxR (DUF448 family)